jgi:hypothetical protein
VVGQPGLPRRALLGAGALAALAAAGCGNRTPAQPAGGDAAVLGTLLALERSLADAWSASGVPARHDVVARLRAHARALEAAGAARGGIAPLVVPPGGRGAEALLATERSAADAYLARLPELRGGDARALAMGLYAAGAQRVSLLLTVLGRDPLPDAFAGTLA